MPTGFPAINAGNDGTCETYDQRGATRPQNNYCDIGAYEVEDANVEVYIGGSEVTGSPYTLGIGQELRENYAVSRSLAVVQSTNGVDLVAAIRLQSFANNTLYSFVETMGAPGGLLSHKYYFPTYNNTWGSLNSQVRFANLGGVATTIRVTIGG